MKRASHVIVLAATMAVVSTAAAAKLETWLQADASAFRAGTFEGVVVSDRGVVRLQPRIDAPLAVPAPRVWDLLALPDGSLVAATGDQGRIFRRAAAAGSDWETMHDNADSQALALALAPDGAILAGTGPSGQVVELRDGGVATRKLGATVGYVWDLAVDSKGNAFAATGPNGQLWQRPAGGEWALLFDAPQPHLLSLAVDKDASVLVGTDTDGIIYRVRADGVASVVLDTPQSEIKTLLVSPEGTIYAGTAAPAPNSGRGTTMRSRGTSRPFRVASFEQETAGTAQTKPTGPGENLVIAIGADGVARERLRVEGLVQRLVFWRERLIAAVGPNARLFELGPDGDVTPIARLDHGQALALAASPDGSALWVGLADPGAVARIESSPRSEGSLVSSVLDAKFPSQLGAVEIEARGGNAAGIGLEVRGGRSSQPDPTWSAWSPVALTAGRGKAELPEGRYFQYRAKLTSSAGTGPELTRVAIRYQPLNLAPELASVEVPDLSLGDGATRQTKLAIKWSATDPNSDKLTSRVFIQKDGWPDWLPAHEGTIDASTFEWDASRFPSGRYRVKVVVDDSAANPKGSSAERSLTSKEFVVDHLAPTVEITREGMKATAKLKDGQTRITGAEVSIDGGAWTPLFPADGLFDAPEETVVLPELGSKAGTHVLIVRATDAAGNVGSADLVFTLEGAGR